MSAYLLISSLSSVLNTAPRSLTACNSEMSAISSLSAASTVAVPVAYGRGDLHQAPPVLCSEWPVGGGSPDCSVRTCCASSPFRSEMSSPFVGPCLEMSSILQACLVLIISSLFVTDVCLPKCTNRLCVQSATIHDLIF